jgi:hypothetical protein
MAATCTDFIKDGSFELGIPSPPSPWLQYSSNYGSPLCDPNTCPAAGAKSGTWWAWFGGTGGMPEEAFLEQNIIIPSGIAQARFYLWNKSWVASGTDFIRARLDGTELFYSLATDVLYQGGYTPVTLDLSPYADGNSHVLRFESINDSADIFVDDVAKIPNETFINYNPTTKKIMYKNNLSLQSVIDFSLLSQEVRAQAYTGSEDITVNLLDANGVLTLRGGFDCTLGNNTGGLTSVRTLTVLSGNVTAQNMITLNPSSLKGLVITSGKFIAQNVILRQI